MWAMFTRFSYRSPTARASRKNNVNTVVLEYIEKNFCQNDICLSKIAEELSLSANLISRIVKEASHRSFCISPIVFEDGPSINYGVRRSILITLSVN